jgi:hypothetical protein
MNKAYRQQVELLLKTIIYNKNMTKNKSSYSPLNHKLAIILTLSFSLLFAVFKFIADSVFDVGNENPFEVSQSAANYFVVVRFATSIFTLYLLYECCFWIFRKGWKNRIKYPVAFIGTVTVALLVGFIFSKAILHFFQTAPESFHHRVVTSGLKKDAAMSIVVFLSTLFISIFFRHQRALLENQRLVAENTRNRYEALKNQLNPHFLFNTLNTLDGLMDLDIDKAHSYLQNLSSSFRYTIQNKEITILKDELNFVESYTYLMKIRYGDDLSIQYDVDEKYSDFHIMPITLQLLIENAIKHNIINDDEPLTIHIETTENDTIKVSNAIQPKINAELGEGIGLANLVERYKLLFDKEVVITQNGVFSVEIPLIEQINNASASLSDRIKYQHK